MPIRLAHKPDEVARQGDHVELRSIAVDLGRNPGALQHGRGCRPGKPAADNGYVYMPHRRLLPAPVRYPGPASVKEARNRLKTPVTDGLHASAADLPRVRPNC